MCIMALEGYHTVTQAAEIIGRSHGNVCRYIRMGMLPAIRIGKSWLIRDEDVRKFTPPPMGNPKWIGRKS
jgi:excisionase family DNA binding protein